MKVNKCIAIIGLGYVGLPLAVEFAKKYEVIGFDINKKRVDDLNAGRDLTLEIEEPVLKSVLQKNGSEKGLTVTDELTKLSKANIYIITVPTPVDKYNRPDLNPLYKASETVGKVLKKGDVVIYESTVFPGATEDECVPVLEKFSSLKFNTDFLLLKWPSKLTSYIAALFQRVRILLHQSKLLKPLKSLKIHKEI
jgi:UDP-N-acetyl-D-galactosamine dehydrogenase